MKAIMMSKFMEVLVLGAIYKLKSAFGLSQTESCGPGFQEIVPTLLHLRIPTWTQAPQMILLHCPSVKVGEPL